MWLWRIWMLLSSLPLGAGGPVEISGGVLADECQFPTVAAFRSGEQRCTGVLIHPRVMLTAAHCVQEGTPDRARFGEAWSPYARDRDIDHCEANPAWFQTGAGADDYAYCVLAEPYDELPRTPLLSSCELDVLREGAVAAMVGFGLPDPNGDFGRKRYAFTTVVRDLGPDGMVVIGDEEVSGCIGDSGGPAFVQLDDGTWRVVGVLVRGHPCGEGPGTYRTLASVVGWLERHSGYDLTPCWDGDGTWEESAACGSFDEKPGQAQRTWSNHCEGNRIELEAICSPSPTQDGQTSSASTGTGSDGSSGGDTSAGFDDTDGRCACRTSNVDPPWPLVAITWIGRVARRRRESVRTSEVPPRSVR